MSSSSSSLMPSSILGYHHTQTAVSASSITAAKRYESKRPPAAKIAASALQALREQPILPKQEEHRPWVVVTSPKIPAQDLYKRASPPCSTLLKGQSVSNNALSQKNNKYWRLIQKVQEGSEVLKAIKALIRGLADQDMASSGRFTDPHVWDQKISLEDLLKMRLKMLLKNILIDETAHKHLIKALKRHLTSKNDLALKGAFSLLKKLIPKEFALGRTIDEEVVQCLEQFANSGKQWKVKQALKCIRILVDHEQGYEMAERVATKILGVVTVPRKGVRNGRMANDIFMSLVLKDQAFRQVAIVAEKLINTIQYSPSCESDTFSCSCGQDGYFLFELLAERDPKNEKILPLIKRLIEDPHSSKFEVAFTLLKTLAYRDEGIAESLRYTDQWINGLDPHRVVKGFSLLSSIVYVGHGYLQATQVLTMGLKDPEKHLNHLLQLAQDLVKKKQAYPQAFQLVQFTLSDRYQDNSYLTSEAYKVLTSIVENGEYVKEATDILERKRFLFPPLVLAVAKQGSFLEGALAFATALTREFDPHRMRDGGELFISLFAQGYGFEGATELLLDGLREWDESFNLKLLSLATVLVDLGHAYEEAVLLAMEGIKYKNGFQCDRALTLFTSLFNQEQGFEEAIQLVNNGLMIIKGLKTKNPSLEYRIYYLLNKLVEKGQAYPQALAVAIQMINRPFLDRPLNPIRLMKTMIGKGHGIDDITACLQQVDPKELNPRFREIREMIHKHPKKS